jgi:hypothetical protein
MPQVTDPTILEQLNGGGQGGPVYGPPPVADVPSPIEIERLNIARGNADLAREKFEYDKSQDNQDPESQANAEQAAKVKLLQLVGKMNQVKADATDNSYSQGLGETGTSGNFMRGVPLVNNAGKDLASNIDTLRANFAFDALQAMRDASKTGGALGQVSELELALLERAVTNIDPNQSHEQFLTNLEEARQTYLSKLAVIDPRLATQLGYDSNVAERVLKQYSEQFGAEVGMTQEPAINRDATPSANQSTPEDIAAIMQKYGVQ